MTVLARLRASARYLAQFEIWAVAGMTAASFISVRLLPAAVMTAAVFWLVRWAAYGHLTLRTPVDGPVLLLLVMVPVTLWATAVPEKTIPQVYRLLTGIALLYAIANWCNQPKRLRLLLIGVSLAGFLLALFAAISVEWPLGKLSFIPEQLYQKFTIVVPDTVNPNVMAGSLVILLPIPLAAILFGWKEMRWSERILHAESAIVMFVIVAFTKSRGSWIAVGAIILALIILRWRRGWLILLPATILALVTVTHFGIPRLLEFAFSSGAVGGWDGRREIWSRAVYMIQDFPFTGIGMGSFAEVTAALYPFFSFSPGSVSHAHNLFLQIAVDLGIPGLVAWLLILLIVIVLTWQLYHHGRITQDTQCAALGAGLICSQLALVIPGMTDAVTWGMVRPAPLVWAVWGLTIAGWNIMLKHYSSISQR